MKMKTQPEIWQGRMDMTSNTDVFSQRSQQRREGGATQPQITSTPPTQPSEPDIFAQRKQRKQTAAEYRWQHPEEDEWDEGRMESEIQRNQAQQVSRMGEAVLGLPGDLTSLVMGLFGKEQDILPTSGSLRETSESATKGYTAPQSEDEEKMGEVMADVALMAIPGAGHYSLARNIGVPVVANLVKEGLDYLGSGEKAKAYGKVGTMIALDLISRRSGGIKKHLDTLWAEAEQAVPKGVSISTKNLEKSLDALEYTFTAGGKKPSTIKSLEKLKEIREEIKASGNGKIPLDRLIPFRKSINEVIDEMGGFSAEVPFKYRPAAKKHLNELKGEVIGAVNQYADKFNPVLKQKWSDANEAYAAYSQSNRIANFIQKKVAYTPQSQGAKLLFSYAPHAIGFTALKVAPVAAIASVPAAATYQAYKVLKRVTDSPVLRKYYGNVLKEAAAGNAPSASKNLKALDVLLLKDQKGETPEQ